MYRVFSGLGRFSQGVAVKLARYEKENFQAQANFFGKVGSWIVIIGMNLADSFVKDAESYGKSKKAAPAKKGKRRGSSKRRGSKKGEVSDEPSIFDDVKPNF